MVNSKNEYSNSRYMLSIVIPTKNRQNYCIDVLRHITNLNLTRTEIIVQDNSDDNSLQFLIRDYGLQDRVHYNYNANVLSFVDNFSEAIGLCRGEYVCMIGDDDSVLPNIEDITEYALNNQIDAIVPKLQVYHWPTQNPLKPNWGNGYLATLPFKSEKYLPINVSSSLKKLINNFFQDYQRQNVPRIYHGVVKRSCIEKVKETCGVYFGGLTPDMFMSVALCFTVKSAQVYSQPITISGICPKSGSADSATGRHTGELKDAPHFRGHKSYDWIDYIPYIYTVDTIWAETGIQALRLMGGHEYENLFNKNDFISYLAIKFPQFKQRLLEFGKKYDLSSASIESYKRKQILTSKLNRFKSIVRRVLSLNIAKHYYNVESIDSACNILTTLYKINQNHS